MSDSERAKSLLANDPALTCVLCHGDTVYTSAARGISPMLDFADAGIALSGFAAADRIVGKAAAMLFVLAGVASVYASVITPEAVTLLASRGIPSEWETLSDRIVNRTGNGPCPMEAAVQNLSDPKLGEAAVRMTRERLRKNK